MKILITGGNGLLGQKLVGKLVLTPETEVIATGKGPCRLPFPEKALTYYPVDIRDHKEVQRLVSTTAPDAIIHAAAMTQVDQCEIDRTLCRDINVEGTRHLVQAARDVGAFVLYISTDFVFNGDKGLYTEEDVPDPVNYYGWSKLEGEQIVQDQLERWAIARTVLVYGVTHNMSRSNLILWVRKSLMDGRKIDEYRPEGIKQIDLVLKGSDERFDSPEQFVSTLWPHAVKTGKRLGVDPKAILAQAALETGWGKSVIQAGDGRSSHRLQAIKNRFGIHNPI